MHDNFKKVYKLKERAEELSDKATKICDRLEALKTNNIYNHHQKHLRRKKLKECLKKVRRGLDFYQDILIESSTFGNEIIVPFLVFYLSQVEGEPYVALRDIDDNTVITTVSNFLTEEREERIRKYESHKCRLVNKRTNSDLKPFYESMENVRQLSCIQKSGNLRDIVRRYEDKKYVILSGEVDCSLLLGMSYNCQVYPYLSYMIYDLMNMKLENHYIGDSERLNVIFKEMTNRAQIRR